MRRWAGGVRPPFRVFSAPSAGPRTGYPFVARRRACPPEAKIVGRAIVRDPDGEGVGSGARAVTLARGIGRRAVPEEIETVRRPRPAGLGHEGMPAPVASGRLAGARPFLPLPAARRASA